MSIKEWPKPVQEVANKKDIFGRGVHKDVSLEQCDLLRRGLGMNPHNVGANIVAMQLTFNKNMIRKVLWDANKGA